MEKLALGLSIITLVITIFFLSIMVAFGVIDANDLKQLRKVVIPQTNRKFKKENTNKTSF